jgi:hypothetical protein
MPAIFGTTTVRNTWLNVNLVKLPLCCVSGQQADVAAAFNCQQVQDIAENDVWECIHAEGTDERHIKLLPSIPNFKVYVTPAQLTGLCLGRKASAYRRRTQREMHIHFV